MSDFGEEIIDRLNNQQLQEPNHPMNKIINNTIGEWLQQEDEKNFLEQFFIQEADNKYLDLHGKDFNVIRKIDESDEDYRNRIIYESMGHITITFLKEVYDVDIYSFVEDFNMNNNDLTSDNPYFAQNKFMGIAEETTKEILNKKFIIGGEVNWL